ncbi:CHAP domain-containing protein [Dankookia rubra]|uniref:CHAP domain-containing protein n=1 Tax=Dankookia rubra TaxID=1442381 RepID=A0A4V3AAN7_9PROT|nr:CHAP domain-containing protein [Dankookia rubra]TDH64145.1 CHAP domain-containing protein [Dankookia rubra]
MRVTGTTLAVCALLGGVATTTEAEAARSRHDTRQDAGHAPASAQAPKSQARATSSRRSITYKASAHRPGASRTGRHAATRRYATAAGWSGGISCVPYARSVTGMAISGNGGDWWSNAAGSYRRGNQPEPGSVMAFRSTGGMSRGHVAVVSRVLSDRQVLIDHANWGGPGIRKGSVMHNVSVVDVSDNNDWTAVRVQSGHSDAAYGRTYPTYGFIYNRPAGDSAPVYAAARPMQRSLRFEQLAEMPIGAGFATQPASYEPQGLAPLRKVAPDRHR